MAANVERMFYVRETPWHGLGTKVQEAPTSKDALILAGLDWSVVQEPVYTGQNELVQGYKVYCLERDEEMIQNLVHIEADFWNNHVQAGVIPAPDGSKLADKVIAEYFSDPVDETIELSGYQKQLERRDELKELIDKMTKEVSLIEQEIKMMMGNAEKAKADNYRISWKASQRTDLDRKRIKAEEPEIYDRFKRTSISRRFIVSAA